ncbi:Lrp/AsnC family transcriptional regulator [Paraburkholderia flagellata]|uniref:Lrp/AsnC family transcriptional regulator n=1 Tax=Paraburkholderia flagellata TaxID=2883241 RepID=UPI001F3B1594|nr:Lrp/AsnC family transcriptional regulator [Paraburkholderia flagellata]
MQNLALDTIDMRLLAALQEHGRASNLELAAAIKLSPAQTLRRHRRLEELGVIRRYETRLDAQVLGFGVVAFIQVTMERGHMRELMKFKELVATLPQVQECYSVTGDIDYVLKVVARDLKALSEFLLDTLMRAPGVNSVQSIVCLDELKGTSAMPLDA